MFDVYVIEIGEDAVGIVSRDGRRFRFHAAMPRFNTLDGRLFTTPRAAEKAARSLMRPIKLP